MGPGTHVVSRLIRGITPTDPVDALAMQHDLDYLTDEEPIFSDLRAILRSYTTPPKFFLKALAMRFGLGLRTLVDALLHALDIPNVTHLNYDLRSLDKELFNRLQMVALKLKPQST